MYATKRPVLGIDIGGVISDKLTDGRVTDASLASARPIEGSLESIARLVANFGPEDVFLVSKCGWRMQRRTKLWLRAIHFHSLTRIPVDHAWFCLERREKSDICRELGVTHFVDDRLEIHGYLTGVRHRFLFRPNEREIARHAAALPSVVRVENWDDAEREILATLSR